MLKELQTIFIFNIPLCALFKYSVLFNRDAPHPPSPLPPSLRHPLFWKVMCQVMCQVSNRMSHMGKLTISYMLFNTQLVWYQPHLVDSFSEYYPPTPTSHPPPRTPLLTNKMIKLCVTANSKHSTVSLCRWVALQKACASCIKEDSIVKEWTAATRITISPKIKEKFSN